MNLILFSLVLFANLWIWKIFSLNLFIALATLATSIFLYLALSSKNDRPRKIFPIFFMLLLFFQLQTTGRTSLTILSNEQIRIRDMRLKEYPPVKFTIFNKTLWIPVAHWFEERPESIAFFRILKNFSQVVDPNLYFFANHPRERIGTNEFEKFPYLLLPLFIYGVFILFEKKTKWQLTLAALAPIILVSLIGNNNPQGPFSLFPFIVVTTGYGLENAFDAIRSSKKIAAIFLIVYLLIFLQMFSYEVF